MRITFIIPLLLFYHSISAQRLNNNSFTKVNSSYDELNPVVSPDGKQLYITIANHPSNVGGKKDQGDVWISMLGSDNQWSAPVHAGNSINNGSFNGVAGFSTDGNEMYLLNHYGDAGTQSRTQGIAVSRREGNGWSKPQNIPIPYFQNKSNALTGHVLGDQSVFVFSAETYGSRGVEDIYATLKGADGKWTEPKNLGSIINTQFQELSPSLSADGKTLYFSSNGRKGSGSFDIYSSTRLDDTWINWSTPVNMGSPFNSEGRELNYRTFEQIGYALYSSTKNSDGYGDIKVFAFDEPFRQDTVKEVSPTPVAIIETPREETKDKQVTIHGKVNNTKTGESIDAKVYFNAPDNNYPVNATTANGYSVKIPSTSDYVVRIEASGYVSTMEKLDIHTYEMSELEMNFKLQPVEVGTTVNLKDVLFEQGKTNLLAQSYPELDLVVSFLKANPTVKIELTGHTDNRGIPGQNVKLSQARVDKVKSYLVAKGIQSKRISGKGYGGSKPIASNDSEETRLFNRRVEFVIKKM
ncbi:MAG: OmpA family protein [Chryseolinea sp.]